MIIRGGENIYCVEIEQRLVDHPRHRRRRRDRRGPPRAGRGGQGGRRRWSMVRQLSDADVQAWVAETLANFKVPAYVEFSARQAAAQRVGQAAEERAARRGRGQLRRDDVTARRALLVTAAAIAAVWLVRDRRVERGTVRAHVRRRLLLLRHRPERRRWTRIDVRPHQLDERLPPALDGVVGAVLRCWPRRDGRSARAARVPDADVRRRVPLGRRLRRTCRRFVGGRRAATGRRRCGSLVHGDRGRGVRPARGQPLRGQGVRQRSRVRGGVGGRRAAVVGGAAIDARRVVRLDRRPVVALAARDGCPARGGVPRPNRRGVAGGLSRVVGAVRGVAAVGRPRPRAARAVRSGRGDGGGVPAVELDGVRHARAGERAGETGPPRRRPDASPGSRCSWRRPWCSGVRSGTTDRRRPTPACRS